MKLSRRGTIRMRMPAIKARSGPMLRVRFMGLPFLDNEETLAAPLLDTANRRDLARQTAHVRVAARPVHGAASREARIGAQLPGAAVNDDRGSAIVECEALEIAHVAVDAEPLAAEVRLGEQLEAGDS